MLNIVNPEVDDYTKTQNHRKILRKRKKIQCNNLPKTKRIVNINIKARWGLGFYI